MRIVVDKVDGQPGHALTVKEVRVLLAIAAKQWDIRPHEVHLKATLPERSRFERPVIYSSYSSRLNICSRGLSLKEAQREVLRELAIQGLNKHLRMVHRLSATEMAEIDQLIAPLLAEAEAMHAGPVDSMPSTESRSRPAYRALETAGYSWDEAYNILEAIRAEKRSPTSRKKANRIFRAEEALKAAGIDPGSL